MCGVFGFFSQEPVSQEKVSSALRSLFLLSESRGKEASGCAVSLDDRIEVFKQPISASEVLESEEYREFFLKCFPKAEVSAVSLIGHSRLVTNGTEAENRNNQPVIKDDLVAIHNGIIVNDAELWKKYPQMSARQAQVDTEVFVSLVRHFVKTGFSFSEAYQKAFQEIKGAATIAMFASDTPFLYLGTNNGSLYSVMSNNKKQFVFTSEYMILKNFIEAQPSLGFRIEDIKHQAAGEGLILDCKQLQTTELKNLTFKFTETIAEDPKFSKITSSRTIYNRTDQGDAEKWRANLKRCTKCLLPETFPFIEFDSQGVCSFCKAHKNYEPRGEQALHQLIEKYRKPGDQPDCLVAISGGRDSCYGLHYIKNVLGLKPLAYTFDWGMVTDLARRNVSRMCGELGVEHILVSADIRQKRMNIRKNINAWLNQPDLGMVPLLMAGDKQYFYFAHQIAKEYGIKSIFFFPNQLEKTYFKSGFCGVDEKGDLFFKISSYQRMKLASYYMKRFLTNPGYLNSSLVDTANAFYCTYFLPNEDLCFLYDYIPWDESEIMKTLFDKYNWEKASDTTTTWRIGDGTASFYNFIYLTMAGFSEIDTFYSNQIREGIISRSEAAARAAEENIIRYDSIREYAQIVGVDADRAIQVINSAPKLYGPHGKVVSG